MPFEWPTPEQVTYRIMRLRRLIAVAVIVPVIVMLGVSFFNPLVLSPFHASIASLAVATLVIGHVVLFPNVTLETISLSLAVSGLVLAMPVIKTVAQWAPEGQESGALVILIGLSVIATGVHWHSPPTNQVSFKWLLPTRIRWTLRTATSQCW